MKLFELNEPSTDVVLYLNEHREDPKMALAEASVRFGLPTEEILAIYRRHLVELFDKPVPTQVQDRDMWEDPTYTHFFQTESGSYKITIDHDDMETGNWLINFYVRSRDAEGPRWSADQTNANKDQIKVLSTVINVLKQVFSKHKVRPGAYIEFFAKGDSRINLYKRLGQKIGSEFGLTMTTKKSKAKNPKFAAKRDAAAKQAVMHFMFSNAATESLDESDESQVPQAISGALAPYTSDFSTAMYGTNKWEVQFEWEGEIVELDFGSPDGKLRLFSCNDACPDDMWESIQKYLTKFEHNKQYVR